MKRLLFITLLMACASLAGHAVIEVDGVFYNTYWAGSHQEAMVVVGDTYDQDKEINYTGLVHANIRDSVSFDGTTMLPVSKIGWVAFQWATDLEEVTIPNTVKTIGEAAFNLSQQRCHHRGMGHCPQRVAQGTAPGQRSGQFGQQRHRGQYSPRGHHR